MDKKRIKIVVAQIFRLLELIENENNYKTITKIRGLLYELIS